MVNLEIESFGISVQLSTEQDDQQNLLIQKAGQLVSILSNILPVGFHLSSLKEIKKSHCKFNVHYSEDKTGKEVREVANTIKNRAVRLGINILNIS